MDKLVQVLIAAILQFATKNPQIVEKLIEALVAYIVAAIQKSIDEAGKDQPQA